MNENGVLVILQDKKTKNKKHNYVITQVDRIYFEKKIEEKKTSYFNLIKMYISLNLFRQCKSLLHIYLKDKWRWSCQFRFRYAYFLLVVIRSTYMKLLRRMMKLFRYKKFFM